VFADNGDGRGKPEEEEAEEKEEEEGEEEDEEEEAGPDGADHGTNPEVNSILLNFVGRCSDGSW
jgi:hypothetical protein